MAVVSIIASPTNKVREMVLAASGWRASASIAAATARPSASAGPMAPKATTKAAQRVPRMSIQVLCPFGVLR